MRVKQLNFCKNFVAISEHLCFFLERISLSTKTRPLSLSNPAQITFDPIAC